MERAQWVRVWKRHVKSAAFLLRGPTKCWKKTVWRLQLRSKLWSSETTTVLRSKSSSRLPMRTLLPTWKGSWREWDPKEDGAMRRCKCSSRPSTGRKWSTRSFSSEMPPPTPSTKCQWKDQTEVNHIGTVMGSLPQIWTFNWPVSDLKMRLLTPSIWMLLTPSETSVLRLAESQPPSTSTLPTSLMNSLHSSLSRFWPWLRRGKERCLT